MLPLMELAMYHDSLGLLQKLKPPSSVGREHALCKHAGHGSSLAPLHKKAKLWEPDAFNCDVRPAATHLLQAAR